MVKLQKCGNKVTSRLILHKFTNMIDPHAFYMTIALKEARKALLDDEVPVGSIIVYNKKVIAKSHNRSIRLCDPTAHAEMQVITSACNYLKSRYLQECILYTTLEPCNMCSGALFWSKIGQLVYGAEDKKQGFSNLKERTLHPKTIITTGILGEECGYLLTKFFQKKRNLNIKN